MNAKTVDTINICCTIYKLVCTQLLYYSVMYSTGHTRAVLQTEVSSHQSEIRVVAHGKGHGVIDYRRGAALHTRAVVHEVHASLRWCK